MKKGFEDWDLNIRLGSAKFYMENVLIKIYLITMYQKRDASSKYFELVFRDLQIYSKKIAICILIPIFLNYF